VPADSGEPKRKLPERADALRVDLDFEEALRAAVATKPPGQKKPKPKKRSSQSASG